MYNTPEETLLHIFGYKEFRPPQKEIIENLLQGNDALVIMPTGGGKSLCYQIPSLQRKGVGIVVSPLISLMKDQVDALRENGVKAAFYNSSLDAPEAKRVLAQLHNNELDLLYAAPERLMSEGFLERLATIPLALFAIDEAHCVSQWGHDFRPEYVQLGKLRQLFPGVPLIALTATADAQTREDIATLLGLENANRYVCGFDRPNIRYTVIPKKKPFDQLLHFLSGLRAEAAGIVYALSRKRVEDIAQKLCARGLSAAAYHAGLSEAERSRVQEAFLKDDIRIVVATVAFGMGIDKPNVRFVVHYDLPKSIESYYQETGRAGRDALPAEALLLFGYGDIAISRSFIEQIQQPAQRRIEAQKLQAMVGFAEAQTCRRRVLLGYFGEPLEQDCGNCDACLNPPEQFDATEAARKALSCVYRVGQSFGMGYVIDVLRGSSNERILSRGHQDLSTCGIGADLPVDTWTSVIRQLIHLGYLEQDLNQYSVLKLTPKAKGLLRGEEKLLLAVPKARPVAEKKQKKGKKSSAGKTAAGSMRAEVAEKDEALYQALRELRKKLADAAGVPAYIVFGDATLIEMAAEKPQDEASLLNITGVGEHKLKKYGPAFLEVLRGRSY